MRPNNWRGKVTNTLKMSGNLWFIYHTSHQRTSMAQGRFKVGPVEGPKPTRVRQGQKYLRYYPSLFPFLGRQAITPPEGGKSLGGGPWGRRNSSVPRHTRQNRPEIKRHTDCNPTTGEERASGFFCRRSLFHMEERQQHFCRATWIESSSTKKCTQNISTSPAWYKLAKSIISIL